MKKLLLTILTFLLLTTFAFAETTFTLYVDYAKTTSSANEIRVEKNNKIVMRAIWLYQGEENGAKYVASETLIGFYFIEEATMLDGIWPWEDGKRKVLTYSEFKNILGRSLEKHPIMKQNTIVNWR